MDRCTWDDDYKAVTQKIRRQLLELAHVSEDDYTAVLMQGSGTFGVESVLTSVVGDQDKVLICSNGAYGKRMTDICTHSRIPFVHYAQDYDKVPDAAHDGPIAGPGLLYHPCGHGPQRDHHRDPERYPVGGQSGPGRGQDIHCGRHVLLRRGGYPCGRLGH
ncbi:MAG: hypothetical protein ACLUJG_07935 [Lawsonibacter sp.]